MKKIICSIIIVSAALLVLGCGTPPGKIVFDPNLPEDSAAVVILSDEIFVLQYNGIDVNENWYPKSKRRENKVTLPAGPTVLNFNLSATVQTGRNSFANIARQNMELRFNFEAGETYYVGVYANITTFGYLVFGDRKFGIGIWNGTTDRGGKDAAVKYWELGTL